MKDLVLPRIESEATTRNYGQFVIVPLESGYGVTVGNALRRVLLSSIPGAAITSLRVSGVPHEFTDVPGAREDMIEFILRVKQIRLRCHSEEQVHLRLSARGKADILAGDIECPSEVEIVNPELRLLTMDAADTELEIDFVAEQGRGYSPSEEREKLPISDIAVDAVFSPIVKVNTSVGRTRVGQITDFDRLVLEKVEPDHFEGWDVAPGEIAFSHSGYSLGGTKSAIGSGLEATTFKLIDVETGEAVLTKAIREVKSGDD